MARFWIGSVAANKLRKEELLAALSAVWRDPAQVKAKVLSLSDDEKRILAIFERYASPVGIAHDLGNAGTRLAREGGAEDAFLCRPETRCRHEDGEKASPSLS
jgi:hypothetical protein